MNMRVFKFGTIFFPLIAALLVVPGSTQAQAQWGLDTVIIAGTDCFGVAVTPDSKRVLVTNKTAPGTVTVLSSADYSILSTISLAGDYPAGIAIAPNGSRALVTCTNPNGVKLIDLLGDSVVATYFPPCTATTLYSIAVTPDGLTAVMPDLSSSCVQEGIRSFDATGKTNGSTFISVNTAGETYGIAIAPDSTTVLVTTFNTSTSIKRINLRTSTVQDIPGIGPSYGVAITHKGERALITSDSIKILSLASNTVTAAIPFQSNIAFQNVAITPDDQYAFVVGDFEIAVVSLAKDSVVQTFSAAGQNVAISPDGMKTYVTDSYNGEVRVYKNNGSGTGVFEQPFQSGIPRAFELFQNHPNPFNPTTLIEFSLPERSKVKLTVYDILGREVQTLVNEEKAPGNYTASFDGTRLSSGIYFCRMSAGKYNAVKKLLLVK